MIKQIKFLVALIGCYICTSNIVWAYDIEVDGICYNINIEDKTVEVTSNNEFYTGTIIIPSYINYNSYRLPVVGIDRRAFYNCDNITKVEMPNTITKIRSEAFKNCRNLKSIKIPESVVEIGQYSFEGCTGLTRVDITDIEAWLRINFAHDSYGSISYCSNPLVYARYLYLNGEEVTHVDVPEGFEAIYSCIFQGCSSLKSVSLPSTLKYISQQSFEGCENLETVNMTDSVSSIGANAFSDCRSLTDLELSRSISLIGSGAFSGCQNLKSIILPDKIKYINPYTFSRCTNLKFVNIPSSVTNISESAFARCGIKYLRVPSSVTYIGQNCFSGCENLSYLIFEDSNDVLKFYYYTSNYGSAGSVSFKSSPIKEIYIGRRMDYGTTEAYNYSPFYENYNIKVITIGEGTPNINVLYGKNLDNSKFQNLEVINCCSNIPIDVPEFTNIQYTSVKINIPKGSYDNYKKHSIWGRFWNICEKEYEDLIYSDPFILNKDSISINVNEEFQIVAIVCPINTDDEPIIWTSSDENIAIVSEEGLVTGVSMGTATITASCGEVSATCEVTVTEANGVEDILMESDSRISVYSLQGFLILDKCTTDDLKELPRGIYIVVTANKRYKIII